MSGIRPKRERFPVIPGYHLETILGRGATGDVYRATQLSVNRLVALKVLRPELVGTSKAVQRLQREARNTARLHHPNIISAIDMGEVGGRWWYAMELVAGPSLARRLKQQGPLSEREALRTFVPLAAALQHLHEQGIVHRDVKPANIVLESGGRALLIDLGLAFSSEDPSITRGGGTLGTPHYISPEQARDPSAVDVRSDIWSLGATLYHAVCGEPPFTGQSVAEIMSRVLYSRVPDPLSRAPELSRGLSHVIRKCLARDPARRYQSPAELQEDLERLRERRAPTVTRKELDPTLDEDRGRWRVAAAVGSVALLAGAIWLAAVRPWEDGVGRTTTAELTEWRPLEEFAEAPPPEDAELGPRYYLLLELSRATPPRFAGRASELRRELEVQLERALGGLKRRLDRELDGLLEASDFAAARALVTRRAERDLERETGFRIAQLPDLRRLEFDNWLESRAGRVEEAVERREERFRADAELFLEDTRRDVGQAQDRQRWDEAVALLGDDFESWLARSDADGSGLESERRAQLLAPIELQRTILVQRLENAWYETDAALKRFVAERARELGEAVERREVAEPAARLEADLEAELRRLGLRVEAMPPGLSRFAVEELAVQSAALARRAERIVRDDARELLRSLQSENEAAWKRREYAAIEDELTRRLEAADRASTRSALESVAGEARRLREFLERAAAGVSARDGQHVTVAVGGGSIQVSGPLRAGVDPLERGFSVSAAQNHRFRLHGEVRPPENLVATRDVVTFAGCADPVRVDSADLRLAAALFLFREEAPLEALSVLSSGDLPADPLVEDLDERIHAALLRRSQSIEQDRAVANHDLQLLRREWRAPHDPRRLLEKARALLTEFAGFLTPEELAEVRSIQSSLRGAERGGGSLEEFQRIFGPHGLEFLGPNRVQMHFRFDEPEVGAWKLGDWRRSAFGWECPVGVPTVVGHPGPSLVLRKPFDVETGVVELELELEQLAPARRLAISAVGFHVVFSGGESPRWLVHSGTLAEANALAESGAGKPFTAFERDTRHTLRLELGKASGDVKLWVDGERLDPRKDMRTSPVGTAQSNGITISAVEPLRLISVRVTGWRE